MPSHWGTKAHTADLGLWVSGQTPAELFIHAVRGLSQLMAAGPRQAEISWQPLELEGQDQVDLLVALLNEAVFRLDAEQRLAVDLQLDHLSDTRLAGRLGLVAWNPSRHTLKQAIKAVTYHQANIREGKGGGLRADLVLDV